MRAFMIFVAALLIANIATAQDLLVKKNGEQMRVKVLKINKKKVQFVRQGTEVPVYTLPVSEIKYIQYPMGDRDTFGNEVEEPKSKPAETTPPSEGEAMGKMWHGPVPPPQNMTPPVIEETPAAQHRYSVGDIYDKDGIKGIVAVVYDGGLHGLVFSLDEACLAWSTLHRKKTKKTGATNQHDGMENMRAIEKYITDNNLSWDDFPAFKWCREKGEGWYLPAINELWTAGTMYMGGTRIASNRRMRKAYNENMTLAGGKPLSSIMFYHSSTEDNSDMRYSLYSHMNSEAPYTNSGYKGDDLFVRAVYKF